MLEHLGRSRNAAIAAFVLGVSINYLLSYYLAALYAILFIGSLAATAAIKRFGLTRHQVYEALRVPLQVREWLDAKWPVQQQRPPHLTGRREVPESFRYVGADLFHQAPGPQRQSPRQGTMGQQQSLVQTQTMSPAAARERTRAVRTVQSTPGPALSSTRFRSNLDFSLNAEVNSPGFADRIVNYHHQDTSSQDNPSSPRPQIGEFHNIRLTQDATPVRRVNLAAQVGLPLIITTPMPQPNYYNQCLPPEDKSVQMEQSPSVLDALKEISRKRLSSDDNHTPAGMKRYKNELINAVNEFPAIIKETSGSSRMISKRNREVVEVSPEKPTKMAKLSNCNEIAAALSSSQRYEQMKAENKKRRAANTPVPEPEQKTQRTDEPQKTPEAVIMREEVRSPRQLFNESPQSSSSQSTPVVPVPKKKQSVVHDIYSPVRLEEKGKASKQLSNKELRQKKLASLLQDLEDYKEPEPVVEEKKPEESVDAPSASAISSPIASITSATTVTTSIQGPVVSSTSPALTKIAPSETPAPPVSSEAAKASITSPPNFTFNTPKANTESSSTPATTTTSSFTGFQLGTALTTTSIASPSVQSSPAVGFAIKSPAQATPSAFSLGTPTSSSATATSTPAAVPSFSFQPAKVDTPKSSASTPNFNFGPGPAGAITTATAPPNFNFTPTKTTAPATSTQSAFSASTPNFNFGPTAATTSATPAGPSFNFTPTTAASAFAGAQSSAPPAFGITTTTTTSSGNTPAFGIGAPAPATTSTGGFSGFANTNASSPFGSLGGAAPPAFLASTSAPAAFGTQTAATATSGLPSPFGVPASAPATTVAPPAFGTNTMFGPATTTTAAAPPFGTFAPATTAASSSSPFTGFAPTTSAPTLPSFSTFANTASPFGTPAAGSAAPPAFGNPTTTAPPPFGTQATAATAFGTGAFGVPATTAAASPFGFSASSTTQQPAAASSPFGGPSFGTGAATGSNIFGNAQPASSAPGGFPAQADKQPFGFAGGFGNTPATAASSTSAFPSASSAFGVGAQPAAAGSTSIFGGGSTSSPFGKKPEPAPLPTAFKFGGGKTDSTPAAAASLFGVPPTQNPFGGQPTAAPQGAPPPFSFNANQPAGGNNNNQAAAPAFNFSGGAPAPTQAAPFNFSGSQPAGGAFAFNANPQPPNPFQQQQQPPQPGGFSIGTSNTNRRNTLQARRRR